MGREQGERDLRVSTAIPDMSPGSMSYLRLSVDKTRLRSIEKGGWIVIACAVALGIAAVNSGNNMLYFVEGLLLALILASGWISSQGLRRIHLTLEAMPFLWAKQLTKIRIRITNHSWVYFVLGLELFLEWRREEPPPSGNATDRSAGYQLRQVVLGPHKSRRANLAWSFAERGLYRLDSVHIGSSGPFGWFYRWGEVHPPYRVLVYPALWPNWDSEWLGAVEAHLAPFLVCQPSGDDFYGIRDFQLGDTIRDIHWPSTARRGTWQVRQYGQPRTPTTVLVLDRRMSQEHHEIALSWAATALNTLVSRFHHVFFYTQNLPPVFVGEPRRLQGVLGFLATCAPSTAAIPAIPDRTLGFWLSSQAYPPPPWPSLYWVRPESLITGIEVHHGVA